VNILSNKINEKHIYLKLYDKLHTMQAKKTVCIWTEEIFNWNI